ncbi:MAG: diaminopropionate ammonia-lyase [Actinomycetota bacterium]|nr:diaminopropionate ammonia-lyase [Actinomycetota bacterium]
MTSDNPAQVFANPRRVPEPAVPVVGSGPRAFHRRLPGYEPTPLVSAPALAEELGLGQVWVKNESRRLGLPSFKILGASWAIYRLLLERLGAEPAWADLADLRAALTPLGPLTLVAATDGNHGRAVAHMARLLGSPARILVPVGTAEARIDGIASEGATVEVVDGTYDDAVAASARLAADDVLVVSDTSWDGYLDVPAHVIEGYATIFAEVDEQLDGSKPDLVVVPMGVGALTAAVVAHYAARATIVAVEPTSAACGLASARAGRPVLVPGPHPSIMAGLNCGTVSLIAWPAVLAGVDVFVAVDDRAAERAMRDLAALGIVAGETGAASLAGLRALGDAGPAAPISLAGRNALVLCTEGATDPAAYERIVGSPPPA